MPLCYRRKYPDDTGCVEGECLTDVCPTILFDVWVE